MIARLLSIAGSDPGGGAGIQQDLKTFQAFGVWGMAVVTAVTVQNTTGVESVTPLPASVVAAQIDAVARDIGVDAAKTGMLAEPAIVHAVARALSDAAVGLLVVDPVLTSSTGDALASEGVAGAIRDVLIPLATLVTPNAAEAEALTGVAVVDRASQAEAARAIVELGAAAAVVTGGHLQGEAIDVFVGDGGEPIEVRGDRILTAEGHGTGCALSAAIAAGLANGLAPLPAFEQAKRFVAGALRGALRLGHGPGPVDAAWETKEPPEGGRDAGRS